MMFIDYKSKCGEQVHDKMRLATPKESEGLPLSLIRGKGALEQAWHGSARERFDL